MEFRFIDLFAGLGGFHQAASTLGGRCVLASEINPKLRETYEKNFLIKPEGDIRLVDADKVPEHDLLCAGFPCQPFSKAGEQMGWKDVKRGTVFWNILEILNHRRPKLVLLENVAHFVRHDEGNTFKLVKSSLEALGYTIFNKQLSPHQFGIPQIRERFYMVGILGGQPDFAWPEPETVANQISIKSVLDHNPSDAAKLSPRVLSCLDVWQEFLDLLPEPIKLPSFPIWSMEFGATYPYEKDSLSRESMDDLRVLRGSFGCSLKYDSRAEIYENVPSHARGHLHVFPKWKKDFIRQNREFFSVHQAKLKKWLPKIQSFPSSLQKFEWNCQGMNRNVWDYVIQFRASGVRVKKINTAPSLVAMTTTQIPIIGWEKRYMTARECARLQSMEDLEHLPKGGAATSALGNAVNVTVVKKIIERLIRFV